MKADENLEGAESAGLISESEVEEWFDSEDVQPEPPVQESDVVKRYSEAQLRIVRSTMDLSLHSLRQSLRDDSYINLHPDYQRRHRWDTKKKSQLIESLLLNIPIPPLFLFENEYNQYEVMDGRQRLEAITGFLDNTYKLRGLEYWGELDGNNFTELPLTLQRGLLRRTVNAIVLLAETSRPEESEIDIRMALFKRLNTGGVKLNPQELRNALYPSNFNRALIKLSKSDTFRECWGIPKYTLEEENQIPKQVQANALYKTMADCELVLRFFAIKETILENRRGSLKSLMDKSMKKHMSDDPATISKLENEYRGTLNLLWEAFDHRPFVLPQTNRPSRPVYDALMVATAIVGSHAITGRKPQIQANFLNATKASASYEVLVGRGNTVDSIKERVELARTILTA